MDNKTQCTSFKDIMKCPDGDHIVLVKIKPNGDGTRFLNKEKIEALKKTQNSIIKLSPKQWDYYFNAGGKYFTNIVQITDCDDDFIIGYHGSEFRHSEDDLKRNYESVDHFIESEEYENHLEMNHEECLHKIYLYARLHHIPIECKRVTHNGLATLRPIPHLINIIAREYAYVDHPETHLDTSAGSFICVKKKKQSLNSPIAEQQFHHQSVILIKPPKETESSKDIPVIPFYLDKKQRFTLIDAKGFTKHKLVFIK